MTEINLSLLDPNTLLPHRAGIAGLALALSAIDRLDAPLNWQIDDCSVTLSWQGNDRDVVNWLMAQAYRIEGGYLNPPALTGCYCPW
jgi:hypothetical protein